MLLLVLKGPDTMQEQRNKQAYKLAVKHYWIITLKNWKTSFSSILLTGVGTVLSFYVPPLIIAKILATYQDNNLPSTADLLPYILGFGGAWLAGEICWRIAIFLLIKTETRGMKQLYMQAMQKMMEKDLAFFHNNFAGSLTKKTNGYAHRYVDVMDTMVFNVAANLLPVFFISFILWRFSPLLVLGLVGMVALTIALIMPLIKYRAKLVAVREIASNKVSGLVADIYSNIDAVRAFSQEKFENDQHRKNVEDLTVKTKRSWDFHNQRIDVVISPLYVLTNLLGLVLAVHIASTTNAQIEVVFITFTYYVGFTRFMWEFNSLYRRLESAFSDAGQFTELLLDNTNVKDVDSPAEFNVKNGAIEFSGVNFHYQENEKQELFEDFSLSIKPGEKIGLVGHSGGGKTTLTKLLLRFMDIDSGAILIDGQDIAKVRQEDLRKRIAYVPQDPYMFHRSITDNIKYGKLDASDGDVKKVAKLSHSAEFIDDLPKKYDTLIGERGVKLSGGQRQRIAVARAMIKDAPILLLDEATSALDSESEKLIQDALWKLMEGRTTIVIAHRLSTIQKMDRILVLENGKIAEQGSHKQLLKNGGIYSDLWQHQSGGFLED